MQQDAVPQPARALFSRMNADEWAYSVARGLLVVALALLFSINIVAQGDSFGRSLYLAALGLKIFDTVAFFYLVFSLEVAADRAMMFVLVPDMITVGTFTYLASAGDWYYAVAVTMPIFYALIARKREAQTVGIGLALAYVAGVLLRGPLTLVAATVFILKAAVIPLATFLVANSVDKKRAREESAEQSATETETLNEQLRRRVHELQAVTEITELIHSTLDFESVGSQVLDIVAQAIDVTTCCLFVIERTSSETLFSASRGTSASDLDEPVSLVEAGDHLTCVPVFDHDPTMVLFCTTAESLEGLSEEDRLVLGAVASELVVAIENSRLYKLTSRLAVTDELTGLANYRHLQQRLDEELARASRYGKHLSLLMLDADDFKAFNDAQGHVAGDVALAELGPIFTSMLREVDVVARYGGEEFSVVLPETDAAGAYVVAEKIREAVELHQFANADGDRACSLTVSVGLATYPTHGDDKDSVLREADDALYQAKNGGKNRVRTPRRHSDSALSAPAEHPSTMSDEWTGV